MAFTSSQARFAPLTARRAEGSPRTLSFHCPPKYYAGEIVTNYWSWGVVAPGTCILRNSWPFLMATCVQVGKSPCFPLFFVFLLLGPRSGLGHEQSSAEPEQSPGCSQGIEREALRTGRHQQDCGGKEFLKVIFYLFILDVPWLRVS